MAGLSLLRVVSNEELARQEQEAMQADLDARQNNSVMLGLAAHIKRMWEPARIAKKPIEHIMLKGMRQRNGEYEADRLKAIKQQGGSEVYMMITEVKCRAAESWLRDILLDTGTPPWDIKPTPIPDLDDQTEDAVRQGVEEAIMTMLQQQMRSPTPAELEEIKEVVAQDHRFKLLQAAQNRADKMKFRISDQFAEGGWAESFDDFITDIVTFPCAFLKGPVVRRQRKLGWVQDESGSYVAQPTDAIGPEYERVDPFRIYPEPGITNLNDGYLFQHHPLTRTMLADLIGVPGYDEQAIRKILSDGCGHSWVLDTSLEGKEEAERKFYDEMRPTDIYDALEFWGKIPGDLLREWGMSEEEVPDPALEYDANVWLVGDYVVKAVLNYDPLGEKPYCKTSFIKQPGAFWGKAIPEIIEDVQNVCNAAARALVNNMGISSGPQVEVNLDRIPANEDITQIYPWKIWQVTNDPAGSSAAAVRFNQPDDNAQTLMGVYEKFAKLADDHSGIPSYLYGDLNVQGAGRTSSGLSMLMGSAGKGIRQVVMHIDSDVIKPVVTRQYIYNMRYDEDESIKGDVQILPRGAVNLATKETLNARRIEFLQATANPLDLELMGTDGRAAILREIAKGLHMPADEVIPSREKLALKGASQPQVPMQQQGGSPPNPEARALDAAGNPAGGADGNMVGTNVNA
jgi:hypothetical protein